MPSPWWSGWRHPAVSDSVWLAGEVCWRLLLPLAAGAGLAWLLDRLVGFWAVPLLAGAAFAVCVQQLVWIHGMRRELRDFDRLITDAIRELEEEDH